MENAQIEQFEIEPVAKTCTQEYNVEHPTRDT